MKNLGVRLKAVLLLTLGGVFVASISHAAQLQSIETASLSGDAVELTLGFDSPPPVPTGYTIDSPARIALDLSGVTNGLAEKYHTLGNGNVRSATVMGAGDRTRVIVNLTSLVAYSSEVKGNKLLIRIGESGDAAVATGADSVEVVEGKGRIVAAQNDIKEIDFRRGEMGEGQISIRLTDRSSPIDLREEGGRVVVEIVGATLPQALRRRLDVVDFATPVHIVDAVTDSGNAKILIEAKGEYEYLAYQTDDLFTVSVKPIARDELERKQRERFQFTGEKLSLNFQDIEVRAVLQLIADFTELNLVASDTVGGRITLRLQNVPWDQALSLILKTKGLDKRQVGNVMLIAPADEIAAREKLELEATKQVEELAPLRTEYITINYAKAEDMVALLTTEAAGFLTDRGNVSFDGRTNTLILQDTSNTIDEVRFLLERLDVPVKQVMIEARIVIARASAAEELGVRWNVFQADFNQSVNGQGEVVLDNFLFGSGSGSSIETNAESLSDADPKYTVGSDSLALDLGVVNSGASSIAFGIFDRDSGLIDIELSALESDGKADVISTPKVLTADQQKARIASGTEIPYQEASSSGATTISFKEAVLSLEVTPQITPDGRIIMDLQINQDSVGDLVFGNIPVIDKNEIKTNVIVDNGQTVVLGGVFRSEEQSSVIKTPFLGDLPVIGRLFRKNVESKEKAELLVFITPKIVTDILATQ